MSIKMISGVAFACVPSAEQGAYGPGVGWQHGPRPRPSALPTLDPTQRPSAPLRWAT